MRIRKAEPEDISGIMGIMEETKVLLKERRVDQWQNGYPNGEVIAADIAAGTCYVTEEMREGAGALSATAVITPGEEMSYRKIYEGGWLTKGPYLVIHRIATRNAAEKSGE